MTTSNIIYLAVVASLLFSVVFTEGVLSPDWTVLAYHRSPAYVPDDLPSNFVPRYIEIPGDRYDAWTQLRLPAAAMLDRVDVLHCPANTCPRWMPARW